MNNLYVNLVFYDVGRVNINFVSFEVKYWFSLICGIYGILIGYEFFFIIVLKLIVRFSMFVCLVYMLLLILCYCL